MDKIKLAIDRAIISIYEDFEVTNKRKALVILKNIVLVLIDEIEEGNFNTFSPEESGIIPLFPNDWGIYSDSFNDEMYQMEMNQNINVNQENSFRILNERVLDVIQTIMITATPLLLKRRTENLESEEEEQQQIQYLLRSINEYSDGILNARINNSRICNFGRTCFRISNPLHLEEFAHPWLTRRS